MWLKGCLLLSLCALYVGAWASGSGDAESAGKHDDGGHFTRTWAVHVEGGRHVADQVAAEHGFINHGEILEDFYHFHHNSVRRRSITPSHYHHRKLSADDRVRWSKQQRILSRKKRDFLPLTTEQGTTKTQTTVRQEPTTVHQIQTTTQDSQTLETSKLTTLEDEKITSQSTTLDKQTTYQDRNTILPDNQVIVDKADQGVTKEGQTTVQDRETTVKDKQTTSQSFLLSTASPNRTDRDLVPPFGQRASKAIGPLMSDTKFPLNDHRWPQMWYLNRGGGLDMNVIPAWREGITGKGVVVAILDDGLEMDHPDLLANYDPQASYDVNNHDEDPSPRYDMVDSNRHGTRCAGEVAATANNTLCAVGVAFGASVGGVRMLDGDVTDAVEARSLSLNPQHIDIYSASWGPDDDGKSVDGPGELATRAFIEGVTKGRAGKGSIFVWASGNGGRDHDNCNCDGYTNSIWTLSISSATEKGEVPWYSEMCSSTLATTYSSGSTNDKQVVTTDLHHSCTSSHTGTSASAPLAAGICALVLEANRDLTWRDMQHIVVRTAKPANLATNGWRTNGVGRNVSHSFGYGLMDASAMVRMARTWRTVPPQHRCEVSAPHVDKLIPAKSQMVLQLAVNQCVGVNYLEHVQAKITLSAARRGDMQINLTSPAGTKATLLASRSHDISRNGFVSWPFMSVHTWGESPYGVWQLEIHNEGRYLGTLSQWSMIFYGTEIPAQAGLDQPPGLVPDPLGQVELGLGEGEAGQHNSIESDRSSARWRDTQKIREDGKLELQPGPPSANAEETSATSGCLSFVATEPQHCIECHQAFFLYAGQCYSRCPDNTFPSRSFLEKHTQPKPKETVAKFDSIEALSSSLKRSTKAQHDKFDMLHYVKKNPFYRNVMKPQPPKVCLHCHYSCLTCSGPYNYQCASCPDDARLVNLSIGMPESVKENYCYPIQVLPQIQSASWLFKLYVIFAIILTLVLGAIFYFILSCLLSKLGVRACCQGQGCGWGWGRESGSVSYNRLSNSEHYSGQHKNADIVKEIHSAIYDGSDSDSSGSEE